MSNTDDAVEFQTTASSYSVKFARNNILASAAEFSVAPGFLILFGVML